MSKSLEDFDPMPLNIRTQLKAGHTELLDKINGKGLCVPLMFNIASQFWQEIAISGSRSSM